MFEGKPDIGRDGRAAVYGVGCTDTGKRGGKGEGCSAANRTLGVRDNATENGDGMRKCLVCEKPVYPQNEVDVQVGIIQSNEAPICEDCMNSENEFVQMDVDDAIKEWNKLPF